ncbi:conserved hypothetical protein [Rippkaea orientalis PCC 8801]|uniref:Endonuclease GajA/Old nuclease/RecF-like AAA domain-containing protein n=1 Tax=Rippkaea orientalis (strain PCC 8801 / RF-1) TaxID=41431 RepID=B7JXN1_RIPO1|nr:ATP-binding protein [Rippkaea orientalis]ACK64788.1 conserved hypothetical protein [Rippkaea orientalis PCC 8801]
MIKDIDIENFRCFERTHIKGFERVNLIGGKNNSGKTALLEAILLNQSPEIKIIDFLRDLRQEVEELTELEYPMKDNNIASPAMVWDSLFFNRHKNENAKIITKFQNTKTQIITLSTKEYKSLPDSIKQDDKSQWFGYSYNYGYGDCKKAKNLSDILIDDFDGGSCSILTLNLIIEELSQKTVNLTRRIIATSKGLLRESLEGLENHLNKAKFISSYYKPIGSYLNYLAQEYNKIASGNKSSQILNFLKILDPSIEVIKTFKIGISDKIYLKKSNQNYLSISLFGEAINKFTWILLELINNPNSILLIDEIENGIHYTNQRDFWKALFELSKELDVQIFATTHSLEMIQAFADVGLNYYPDSGAYFEMARHYKTNQIIGICYDLETLEYSLERGKGVRGE